SDNTLLERYQTTWYVGDTSQDEQFSQSLNIRKTYCTVELDIVIHCYTTYTQEYFDLIYKARLFNPSEDWRTGHWEEAGGVYNPEWIDMWVTIWTAINPTFPDPPK
ncbi:MAG: hypothetical protein JW779_10525, partial [Candidatus Thorarchaeota archaeon]|nr:hypothetical protein [Candidatus Thorarchaeota archaeon]